jgi:hypothetical protein
VLLDCCTLFIYVKELGAFSFFCLIFLLYLLQQEESPLTKVTRDSSKITAEQVYGLMSQVILDVCLDLFIALCFSILLIHYNGFFQVIKDMVFNSVHPSSKVSTGGSDSSGPELMVETRVLSSIVLLSYIYQKSIYCSKYLVLD